ncbi:hypothetical protein DSO57_1005013 [Entomophthora muscae]|uniref:Uncharacterized protein n=1 Tax=Entomophthora muscae TaxID=34485 RepID=A0ACC2TJL5_9FUNG|nr:hypothetical protein DSO57_1005013 [Entomophthora muscae]
MKIETIEGLVTMNKGIIKHGIEAYYTDLYLFSEIDSAALKELKTKAQLKTFTPNQKEQLLQEIPLEEVLKSIKESPNWKALGPDCTLADMYKPICHTISPHLVKMLTFVVKNNIKLPEGMRCPSVYSSKVWDISTR